MKRKFQGRSEKFYEDPRWSFEVSVQSFVLNFKVSDQRFEVRARLNRFDCNIYPNAELGPIVQCEHNVATSK